MKRQEATDADGKFQTGVVGEDCGKPYGSPMPWYIMVSCQLLPFVVKSRMIDLEVEASCNLWLSRMPGRDPCKFEAFAKCDHDLGRTQRSFFQPNGLRIIETHQVFTTLYETVL